MSMRRIHRYCARYTHVSIVASLLPPCPASMTPPSPSVLFPIVSTVGSRDLADHTPNGPACKATACDLCGTTITPVSHNLPYTCKDAECEICHEIITATESHDLSSDATRINQTCTVCESIVKASTPHDYIYTQHYKHCEVCNDIVHFQQEDDSSNNWWWIRQQQAQAERIAKELQEGREKQKNAVSVAVGVAAALMCALFLMTEVRRQ